MKSLTEPVRITWALAWRSTLLAPVFLAFYVVAAVTWMGRFFFPVLILAAAFAGDWLLAGTYGFAWFFSLVLWRWRRFRDMFENPPSTL